MELAAIIKHHWRDRAIARSEIVSDAWEVTKAWAARLAEWVLFLCMIVNIIEILPGVKVPPAIVNGTLAVQVVSLDVAGFGLASMGAALRRMGQHTAAQRASVTGRFLIGIMLATLIVVTVGILWPTTLPTVKVIEQILILTRVGMTVIYGHVVHSLRVSSEDSELALSVPTTDESKQTVPTNVSSTLSTSQVQTPTSDTDNTKRAAHLPTTDNRQEVDTDSELAVPTPTEGVNNVNALPTPTPTKKAPTKTVKRQATKKPTPTNDNRQRILEHRLRHPEATQQEIADALGLSKRTVERHDARADAPALQVVK